jgi:hypothetical protein
MSFASRSTAPGGGSVVEPGPVGTKIRPAENEMSSARRHARRIEYGATTPS